jgi:hypothetical protein
MFHKGTKFHIGGLPLEVTSSQTFGQKLIIEANIITDEEYNHNLEINNLFDKIFVLTKPKEISELIVDWYIISKIKLRQNVVEISTCKKDLFSAQLRKLFRAGETWSEIVNVLSFSMFDKFWTSVVARNYRILAGGQDKSKIAIYYKIKDQLIEAQENKKPEPEMGEGKELEY